MQVAEAIGVAESHYQRFERGANLPNLENVWKLADHFGVTIDYLVGRSDKRGNMRWAAIAAASGISAPAGACPAGCAPILFLVLPKKENAPRPV